MFYFWFHSNIYDTDFSVYDLNATTIEVFEQIMKRTTLNYIHKWSKWIGG